MKKLFLLLLLAAPLPASADMIHRISTSAESRLDNAFSTASRIGSAYSVSGTNIQIGTANSDVFGGLTAGNGTTTSATQKANANYKIHTEGSSFVFQESFIQGDGIAAVGSGSTVTNGAIPNLPIYGTTTTGAGGHTAPTITLTSEGLVTGVGGGPGTSAIIQTVSELSVLN